MLPCKYLFWFNSGEGWGVVVVSESGAQRSPGGVPRRGGRDKTQETGAMKLSSDLCWGCLGGWLFAHEWIVEMDLDVFQKGRQWRARWVWMPEAVKTWVGTWGMAGEMVFGGRAEGRKPFDLALENCIDYWLCRGFLPDSVLWAVEPKVPSLFYPIRV